MANRSPTLEGFRAMFGHPSFGFAEVAWRWSFGAAATILLAFGFIEYLDSLPVSAGDLILLESNRRDLISRTVSDILHGSASRLTESIILLALLLATAWVVLASLGRAITTNALLAHFDLQASRQTDRSTYTQHFSSLLGLNFLRAMATIAAIVGSIVPWFYVRITSAPDGHSIAGVFLGFLALITLVWLVWYVLDWILSLAALFIVSENHDTLGAIRAAVDFSCTRLTSVIAVSAWFGFAHFAILLFTASAVMV